MILNLATDLPLLFCSIKLNLSMVPQQVRRGTGKLLTLFYTTVHALKLLKRLSKKL